MVLTEPEWCQVHPSEPKWTRVHPDALGYSDAHTRAHPSHDWVKPKVSLSKRNGLISKFLLYPKTQEGLQVTQSQWISRMLLHTCNVRQSWTDHIEALVKNNKDKWKRSGIEEIEAQLRLPTYNCFMRYRFLLWLLCMWYHIKWWHMSWISITRFS